jgi:C-terminal peptidase prc
MVIFRGSQIGMKKNPAVFKLIIILFFTLIINNIAFADPQKFSNTIRDIQQYYIYPQSQQKLFDSAIRGMLEGLDPHCAYLNKADLKAMNDTTQSQFAGVGLDVSMEAGLVRVITPLDGSPAQEAGIQSGDYITMIDNTSVTGLTLRAVVHKLRGPQDSQVTLTILKNKASKPFSVVLTRDTIHIQSVKSELFNGVYGYIKLAQFQSSTFKEMMNAINQLKKESLEKNVLQGLFSTCVIILADYSMQASLLQMLLSMVSKLTMPIKRLSYQQKGEQRVRIPLFLQNLEMF